MSRVVDVARTVVPVESKHTAHCNAPLERFVSRLELKNCLQLQSIVALAFLLRVIIEEVLLWWLKMLYVFSAEFVDLSDPCRVLLGSLVEVRGVVFAVNFLLI